MRGGKREGAGRKKGKRNAETEARALLAEKLATEQGITPLEVMLTQMRRAWDTGEYAEARSCARDAAPYCHPRLSNIDAKVSGNLTIVVNKPK